MKHSVKPIAITGLIAFFLLTGCGTFQEKNVVSIPVVEPVETIDLRFEQPLIIMTPRHDPSSVEEHLRTGLFFFQQERYLSARDQFEKARQRISSAANPIYRNCLVSIAICDLLADDKQAFVKTVRELKYTYTKYQLVDINGRNGRIKTIFSLYDKLVKNRNF